jgi:hypothetical protein
MGSVLGLDSRPAPERCFQEAVLHTQCFELHLQAASLFDLHDSCGFSNEISLTQCEPMYRLFRSSKKGVSLLFACMRAHDSIGVWYNYLWLSMLLISSACT